MTRLTELSVYLSSLNWHMYMCHEDFMKNNRKSCIGLVRDSSAVRRLQQVEKSRRTAEESTTATASRKKPSDGRGISD